MIHSIARAISGNDLRTMRLSADYPRELDGELELFATADSLEDLLTGLERLKLHVELMIADAKRA